LIAAYKLATKSPDPSTQNAAIIRTPTFEFTESEGINEFPAGVEYKDERWERPLKYKFIEHAERNAIFNAAKHGIPVEGSTMICPWAACSDCARAIVQSGITTLVTHKQAHDRSPEFWQKEIDVAMEIMGEAGVSVVFYDGDLGCDFEVLHSGQKWKP